MFLVDIKLNAKTRKILSTFLTFMNLIAVLEAKTVLLCGVYLHMKHAELSDVIGDGFTMKALPILAEVMGLVGLCISSFAVYVLFRCRIESYRRRKSLIPTIATNLLVLLAFTWLALVILTMGVFSFQGDSRTDILGLRLEYIYEGVIREAMRLYKKDVVVKSAIDRMQMRLECCGEDLYTDWLQLAWVDEKYLGSEDDSDSFSENANFERGFDLQGVPYSCCDLKSNKPCHYRDIRSEPFFQKHEDKSFTIHAKGCKSAINAYMLETIKIFGLVAISNVVFNFSAALSSRFLIYATFIDDPGPSSADGSTLASGKLPSPYSPRPTTFLEMSIRKSPFNSRPSTANVLPRSQSQELVTTPRLPFGLSGGLGDMNIRQGIFQQKTFASASGDGLNTGMISSPTGTYGSGSQAPSPFQPLSPGPRGQGLYGQANSLRKNLFGVRAGEQGCPLRPTDSKIFQKVHPSWPSSPYSQKTGNFVGGDGVHSPFGSTRPPSLSSSEFKSLGHQAGESCQIDNIRLRKSRQICEKNCGVCHICRFNSEQIMSSRNEKLGQSLFSNTPNDLPRSPFINALPPSPTPQQPRQQPLFPYQQQQQGFPPRTESFYGSTQPIGQPANRLATCPRTPSGTNLASPSFSQLGQPTSSTALIGMSPQTSPQRFLAIMTPRQPLPFRPSSPRVTFSPEPLIERTPSGARLTTPFNNFQQQQQQQFPTQSISPFFQQQQSPQITAPRPLPTIESSFQITKTPSDARSPVWKPVFPSPGIQPNLPRFGDNTLTNVRPCPRLEPPARNIRPGQGLPSSFTQQPLFSSPTRTSAPRMPSIPEQSLLEQSFGSNQAITTTTPSYLPMQIRPQTASIGENKPLGSSPLTSISTNRPLPLPLPLRQITPAEQISKTTPFGVNVENVPKMDYNRESVIMSEFLSFPDLCENEVKTTATTTTITTTNVAVNTSSCASTVSTITTTSSNVLATGTYLTMRAPTLTQRTATPLPLPPPPRLPQPQFGLSPRLNVSPSHTYATIGSPLTSPSTSTCTTSATTSTFNTFQNQQQLPSNQIGGSNFSGTNLTSGPTAFAASRDSNTTRFQFPVPAVQLSSTAINKPLPILRQGVKPTVDGPRVYFQDPISKSINLSPRESFSGNFGASGFAKKDMLNQSAFRGSNYNASNVTNKDSILERPEIQVNNSNESDLPVYCNKSSIAIYPEPVNSLVVDKVEIGTNNNSSTASYVNQRGANSYTDKTDITLKPETKTKRNVNAYHKRADFNVVKQDITERVKMKFSKKSAKNIPSTKYKMNSILEFPEISIKDANDKTSEISIEVTNNNHNFINLDNDLSQLIKKSSLGLDIPSLLITAAGTSPKNVNELDKPEICVREPGEMIVIAKLNHQESSESRKISPFYEYFDQSSMPLVCVTNSNAQVKAMKNVQHVELSLIQPIELTKKMTGNVSRYKVLNRPEFNNRKNSLSDSYDQSSINSDSNTNDNNNNNNNNNSNNNNNNNNNKNCNNNCDNNSNSYDTDGSSTDNYNNNTNEFSQNVPRESPNPPRSVKLAKNMSQNIKEIAKFSNVTLSKTCDVPFVNLPLSIFQKYLTRSKIPSISIPVVNRHDFDGETSDNKIDLNGIQCHQANNVIKFDSENKDADTVVIKNFDNQNDNQKKSNKYKKYTDYSSDESEILKLLAMGMSCSTDTKTKLHSRDLDSLDKIIEYLGGYSLSDLASCSSSLGLSDYTCDSPDSFLHSSSLYFYDLLTSKYPWLRSRLSHRQYLNGLLSRGLLSVPTYDTCSERIYSDYVIPHYSSHPETDYSYRNRRPMSVGPTQTHHSVMVNEPLRPVSELYPTIGTVPPIVESLHLAHSLPLPSIDPIIESRRIVRDSVIQPNRYSTYSPNSTSYTSSRCRQQTGAIPTACIPVCDPCSDPCSPCIPQCLSCCSPCLPVCSTRCSPCSPCSPCSIGVHKNITPFRTHSPVSKFTPRSSNASSCLPSVCINDRNSTCRCCECCCDRCGQICCCCCKDDPCASVTDFRPANAFKKMPRVICKSITDIIPLEEVPRLELASDSECMVDEYPADTGKVIFELDEYCPLDRSYVDLDRYSSTGNAYLDYKTCLLPKKHRFAKGDHHSESEYGYDKSKADILKEMTERLIKNSKKIRKKLIKLPKVKKERKKAKRELPPDTNCIGTTYNPDNFFRPIHNSYENFFLRENAYLEQRRGLRQLFGDSFLTKWNNPCEVEKVVRHCSCTGLTHDTSPVCGYKIFKSKKKIRESSESGSESGTTSTSSSSTKSVLKKKTKKKVEILKSKSGMKDKKGKNVKKVKSFSKEKKKKAKRSESEKNSESSAQTKKDKSKSGEEEEVIISEKTIVTSKTTDDAEEEEEDPNANNSKRTSDAKNNSNQPKSSEVVVKTGPSSYNLPSNFRVHPIEKPTVPSEQTYNHTRTSNRHSSNRGGNEDGMHNNPIRSRRKCDNNRRRLPNDECFDPDKSSSYIPIPKPRSCSPRQNSPTVLPRACSTKTFSISQKANPRKPIPSPRKNSLKNRNALNNAKSGGSASDLPVPKINLSSQDKIKSNGQQDQIVSQGNTRENNKTVNLQKATDPPKIMINKKFLKPGAVSNTLFNDQHQAKNQTNDPLERHVRPRRADITILPKVVVSDNQHHNEYNRENMNTDDSAVDRKEKKVSFSREVLDENIIKKGFDSKSESFFDSVGAGSSTTSSGSSRNNSNSSSGSDDRRYAEMINILTTKQKYGAHGKQMKKGYATRPKITNNRYKTNFKNLLEKRQPTPAHPKNLINGDNKLKKSSVEFKSEPKNILTSNDKYLGKDPWKNLKSQSMKTDDITDIYLDTTSTLSSSQMISTSDISSFSSLSGLPAASQKIIGYGENSSINNNSINNNRRHHHHHYHHYPHRHHRRRHGNHRHSSSRRSSYRRSTGTPKKVTDNHRW